MLIDFFFSFLGSILLSNLQSIAFMLIVCYFILGPFVNLQVDFVNEQPFYTTLTMKQKW